MFESWHFSAAQRSFAAEVQEILAGHTDSPGEDPRPAYAALGTQGLLAPSWPTQFGGRGLGRVEDCILLESLCRAGIADTLYVTTVQVVGGVILQHGSPGLRSRVLPELAAGSVYASVLFSEPSTGSDLAAIQTQGDFSDAGVSITGTKTWSVATSWADGLGYPVVIKPRSLAGSIAVRMVNNESELREAYTAAAESRFPGLGGAGGVLVEEYVTGQEVSVDCWVLGGEVQAFVTARKTVAFAPYFEEVRHTVGGPVPGGPDLHAVARAAVLALGLDRVVAHVEIMLTDRGPRVIEVNGRLGGDLIPYLGQLSGAGSAGAIAATVASGRRPETTSGATERAVGVQFVYPEHDMVFEGLRINPEIADEPWLEEVRMLGTPGTEVRLPPHGFLSRVACSVVTADDLPQLILRMDAVATGVRATGTSLKPA